ncbi:MAG: hypothetical protein IJL85_04495 [Erysipelotrichaceae bacterium]|nr:hypothetical protein [Erysipelotrichaceae bacterium]
MNIDYVVVFFMIVADLVLVLEILYFIIRRNVSNKLIRAAFERNEAKFEAISKTFAAKTLSRFDMELIRFNVAELQRDDALIEKQIGKFEEMELKDSQKKKVYPQIFYYYIDRHRKEDATRYYNKLSEFDVYRNKRDIEMTYDAYVRGSHMYLEEALKDLKKCTKIELPAKERLVAKMYANKGINAEAKKYNSLADKHEAQLKGNDKA